VSFTAATECQDDWYIYTVEDFNTLVNAGCVDLGNVALDGVVNLTTLEGLESVTSIQKLQIYSSHFLTSLKGLENVNHIGSLTIRAASSLSDLDALANIKTLSLNISFSGIKSIVLKNLQSCGYFYLDSNRELSEVEVSPVTYISDLSIISRQESIDYLATVNFPNLSRCGSLELIDNYLLQSFTSNLSQVNDHLTIDSNHQLWNIGMPLSRPPFENLTITNNDILSSLDFLQNMETFAPYTNISNNVRLESIDELKNPSSCYYDYNNDRRCDLIIQNNNKLEDCLATLCDLCSDSTKVTCTIDKNGEFCSLPYCL